MTFTHGQTAKLATIVKGNVLKLSPDRQVGAIKVWIDHNKRSGALDVFVAKDVAQLREWITAIGDYCGCYTGHPAFKQALAQVIVNRDEGMFAEVIGRHGRVPALVVEAICEKYKMKRPVVLEACNTMAAAQGMNGVKVITHKTYTHELKLLPMGDERVYASTAMAGVPVFDKVAKHL
jgi:hypothetical protein